MQILNVNTNSDPKSAPEHTNNQDCLILVYNMQGLQALCRQTIAVISSTAKIIPVASTTEAQGSLMMM